MSTKVGIAQPGPFDFHVSVETGMPQPDPTHCIARIVAVGEEHQLTSPVERSILK